MSDFCGNLARRRDPLGRSHYALALALRAFRPDAEFDNRCYVTRLGDNLLCGLTQDDLEAEFGSAAGHELVEKARAPWSSAILAVNALSCWKTDAGRLSIAGTIGFDADFELEARCPNGVSAIPPHLDALLEHSELVLGVESKCTEYLSGKRRAPADAYLALAPKGDVRAESRWFAVLGEMPEFWHLDAYQLIKHYLGMRHTHPGRPLKLVYLFWEPVDAFDDEFVRHRNELSRFEQLVGDDPTCSFAWLTYTDHWNALDKLDDSPQWLDAHLRDLRARYEVTIND